MPVYNFLCPVCGERFEERLTFQDSARQVVCPRGHMGARKVFSAPSVVYKGAGFYVTDHRKKPASTAASD